MLSKILEYAGEYRKYTYCSIAVMLMGIASSVMPFFLLHQLIVALLGYDEMVMEDVVLRVGAMIICEISYAVFYVYGLKLSHKAAYHTLKNIRISLQRKMEKQPLGAIQENGAGVIKKMFIDDIETIELLLAHALPEGFANVAVPVFGFIIMFATDWKLTLLSLCSLPIGFLAMGMMYKAGMNKMGDYYQSAQKMNNTIIEYINGMEVVKVFNRDGESYKRLETDIRDYRDFTLKWYKVCWPWMAIYNSVIPCVMLFTLPIGAYLVLLGHATLPHLVLVLCMSIGIGAPLLRALSFLSTLPQINYKIENLEQLMNVEPLKQTDKEFTGNNYDISFEKVRFSYKETEVLHGVSFTASEGQTIALVGESGSGKSTLAKLLVHFYDVTNGSIKIGGQDITDMSLCALNEKISYVSQEQFLFHMSLLENIRIGKPDASDEEVLEAAKRAQCEEFLGRLEHGIYTMAGDGGKQLSGGERQRIALARAILKNAPIIVLDEATAFMDPENEEKMNAAIAEIIRGKTVIVIAHRLHTIMHADKICVMKEGNLIAEGTHTALLDTCGEYSKLWMAAEGSAKWKVSAKKEEQA